MSAREVSWAKDNIRTSHRLAERIRDGGFGIGAIAVTAQASGHDFDTRELKAFAAGHSQGMLPDEKPATVAAAGSIRTATTAAVVAG